MVNRHPSVEPIYESLKSLQPAAGFSARQSKNGSVYGSACSDFPAGKPPSVGNLSAGEGVIRGSAVPLQRSPALRSCRMDQSNSISETTDAADWDRQIELCQDMARTLEDFSKTVQEQCNLVAASNGGSEAQPSSHVAGENPIYQSKREALPKTGTGHTKYYGTGEELNQNVKRECVSYEIATGQNKKLSDSGASKMEIQEVCRKEQQQPGGFARRNSKKIQPNKVRNQIVSQKSSDQPNNSADHQDMVFTRTTTYVNVVSEPKVTVAEKVVASKVKNIVTPGSLDLMSSNLPFIDDPVSPTLDGNCTNSLLKTKLQGLDRLMQETNPEDDELFVDAHDESAEIERAIMEAAGVDDNTDKIVESIQLKSSKGGRNNSIKDTRSS